MQTEKEKGLSIGSSKKKILIKYYYERIRRDVTNFIKWMLLAILTGLVVGGASSAFAACISAATEYRNSHLWVFLCLPLAGIVIVFMYERLGRQDGGTNQVLSTIKSKDNVPFISAPLIFISTLLTHLTGGSAGREGASIQFGGSIGSWLAKLVHLDETDHHVMIMCGMSAAFAAVFGTPMAAAVFAMEVVSVGVMYYAALVPCTVSALTAFQVAQAMGLHQSPGYEIGLEAALGPVTMVQAAALGILCALVSILFCQAVHTAPKVYARFLPNPLLRAAAGGALVLVLTLLVGSQDYNGAGDAVIRRMLAGETIPAAFLLKILFTALTLGAGFRGGEIVPALFTGAAFGTLAGPLLGLPHGFGGALGMAAVFCGATNCPLTSLMLAFELFGGGSLPLCALCCGVSYMLSGYYGLYSEQKIVYSKFRTRWIDRKVE